MTEPIATLTILGPIPSWKNSMRIIPYCNRPALVHSKLATSRMTSALYELRGQWVGRHPINQPVSVRALIGIPCFRAAARTDLDNQISFILDALEKSGILADDLLVEHFDGTRRVYLCDTCELTTRITSGAHQGELKRVCKRVKTCPKLLTKIEIYDAWEYRAQAAPISETIERLGEGLPESAWDGVPTNLAQSTCGGVPHANYDPDYPGPLPRGMPSGSGEGLEL